MNVKFLEKFFMSDYAGYTLLSLALMSAYGPTFLPVIAAAWLLIPSRPFNDEEEDNNKK